MLLSRTKKSYVSEELRFKQASMQAHTQIDYQQVDALVTCFDLYEETQSQYLFVSERAAQATGRGKHLLFPSSLHLAQASSIWRMVKSGCSVCGSTSCMRRVSVVRESVLYLFALAQQERRRQTLAAYRS